MLKKIKTNEQFIIEYQQEKDPIKKKAIADTLYKKIFKLVVKNAGTMPSICYGTREDLIQEASLIFMRCINKFNPTKKIKFSTYFGDACKYELRRYKDKQRKYIDNSYYLEIDEILNAKPDNIEDKLDDTKAIQDIQRILLELKEENKITDKQFGAIIEEHGFFGCKKKSRKEMAEERNCSLQNVGFLYRKALDRVREAMEEEENNLGGL